MKKLNVEIISIEGRVFQGEVAQVVAPCASGSIGVLAGHEHLISDLKEGKIEVLDESNKLVKEIDVSGGTLEVYGDNDLRILIDLPAQI